jgi:Leucine-rich repeat (LRR) protein
MVIAQTAEETARQFFAQTNGLKSSSLYEGSLVPRYKSVGNVKTEVIAYQSKDRGFVLVVGGDNNYFVAGYSPTANFDYNQMPDALLAIIKSYEEADFSDKGNSVLKSSGAVAPLLHRYNIKLDQFNHPQAGNCYTGCVATAFAQIMAFHRYPNIGVGNHCYTHPVFGQQCADIENMTLNWDNMTEDDYKLLSYNLGVAMDMSYCGYTGNMTGSSPTHPDYATVLERHYKYHVHFGSTSSYYIHNELKNERPVYIAIYGPNSGHAVVVDGIDNSGRFHINFGWGGHANGYYMLNNHQEMEVGGRVYGTNIRSAIFVSPSPFTVNQQDSLALISIYESFNRNLNWDITKPVVKWPGVLVFNGRVIELKISNNTSTEGYLPEEIGNLSELRNLSVTGKIHGSFPSSIYGLDKLETIAINSEYGSTFKAHLDNDIGNLTQLKVLQLNGVLEGYIPASIGNLTQLQILTLSENKFEGSLPNQICNLTNLITLSLNNSNLSGSIPANIGNLKELRSLFLNDNSFTGALPQSIGNLTNLLGFDAANNQLSGTIPSSIGNLKQLATLRLNNNILEGEVPAEIGNLNSLTVFELSNNKLTSLPNEIGRLQKIRALNLSNNQLIAIPDSIVRIPDIISFEASNNKIAYLPNNFGAWRNLTTLDLSHNQISVFPEELCNLLKLSTVRLNDNNITAFPVGFERMVPPSIFYINNNEIEGKIPEKHLAANNFIFLSNNRLTFESIPNSSDLKNAVFNQKNVRLNKSLVKANADETIAIDIRELTGLNHPDNEYYWFKYPESLSGEYKDDDNYNNNNPVLTIKVDEDSDGDTYYCKVFNASSPSYTWLYEGSWRQSPVLRSLNTDAVTIAIQSDDERLEGEHPGSVVLSQINISNASISDNRITLVSPFNSRGEITWHASTNGSDWHKITPQMTQNDLWANIVSQNNKELVIEPVSPAFYRCMLTEQNCDPLISDAIKVNPFGKMLFDGMVNVKNEPFTVSADSIEVTLPAGLTDESFRLTIAKLDNPPAAPNGFKRGSVYDVTVSFASVFDIPLEIRLKNIDIADVDLMNIPDFKPLFYDDKAQKWVEYNDGGISFADSSVYFRTHHLTKLSWWESIEHRSFTHKFENDKVQVIYKYASGSTEDANYHSYWMSNIRNASPKSWHSTNTDPDAGGTPYLIQDVAEYMHQIITKFDGAELKKELPRKFIVYVYNTGHGRIREFLGYGDAHGYISGSGYSYGYFNLNSAMAYSTDEVRRTLAHEYMHFIQSNYFDVVTGNYFFAEAHAPLADRFVWKKEELEIPEAEQNLKQAINPEKGYNSIYDLLSKSWDAGTLALFSLAEKKLVNSADANVSSAFLHYMRSHREGDKLDIAKLLTEHKSMASMTNWSWRAYLNNRVQTHLSSTLGDEYDAYVRYLLEGSNENFTIINKGAGNPLSQIIKNSGVNNDGSFARRASYNFAPNDNSSEIENVKFSIPYLASKIMVLSNQTPDRAVVVKYKPNHEAHPEQAVYYGRYDFEKEIMVFHDISDSTSYSILLDARTEEAGKNFQNMAFLLFVNKRCPAIISAFNDFNADFELTAFPVVNIDDLVYANVTDKRIHNYDDGQQYSFIISGRMDWWKVVHLPYEVGVPHYSRTKSMINDSTFVVDVEFSEFSNINNGSMLPASVFTYDKKQTIKYNVYNGTLEITQTTVTIGNWGGYFDSGDVYHHPYKHSVIEDNQHIVLRDVFFFDTSDYGDVIGETHKFATIGTTDTKNTLVKMSHSFTKTEFDKTGEVINTSSGNYINTDFSGNDVTITLYFNYK